MATQPIRFKLDIFFCILNTLNGPMALYMSTGKDTKMVPVYFFVKPLTVDQLKSLNKSVRTEKEIIFIVFQVMNRLCDTAVKQLFYFVFRHERKTFISLARYTNRKTRRFYVSIDFS